MTTNRYRGFVPVRRGPPLAVVDLWGAPAHPVEERQASGSQTRRRWKSPTASSRESAVRRQQLEIFPHAQEGPAGQIRSVEALMLVAPALSAPRIVVPWNAAVPDVAPILFDATDPNAAEETDLARDGLFVLAVATLVGLVWLGV